MCSSYGHTPRGGSKSRRRSRLPRLWPSRYYAAARGQEATLDKLLSEGGNPDWFNPQDGLTPLQIAALKGRAACVYRLLVAGAPKILSTPALTFSPNL